MNYRSSNHADIRCALLNLGGTIGEVYTSDGRLMRLNARELIEVAGLPPFWPTHDIAQVDSVDLSFGAIFAAARVIGEDADSAGFILCCGTDMLEEVAYAAALLLPRERPVVVTAAVLPASDPGNDGPANLRRAAMLISCGAPGGVHIVMGDMIYDPFGIAKLEPQGFQPFAAADGPIGRLRAGLLYLSRTPQYDDRYRDLQPEDCTASVAIITECFGGTMSYVDPDRLDGLVVAGAGAGGLNSRTLAMLREHYLPLMPVVLSTRCAFGFVVNPDHPKHAFVQACADGLRVEGYTQLGALQARIRLILEIGLERAQP
ncbi:MAG: asparaginase domain-containing protein [Sphingomonadaceae bacterium]